MREEHHPQCVSLYLGWRWGWGSFISSTECLPLPRIEVGEGLICIVRVSPSTLGGGGGLAHLHRQSVSLYLGWRWGRGSLALSECLPLPGWRCWRGSFASSECLPISWVEVGEGLICILHNVTPSAWDGGGGEAHLQCQNVSIYLGWRWGRGSFALSECLPLPWLEVGEGLICILHNFSPLPPSQVEGRGSFASPESPST